jgi:hypothetical protein
MAIYPPGSIELLQLQLEKLRTARASGARKVEMRSADSTRMVEYKTDSEMMAAIADLERRIATWGLPRVRTVQLFTSKGLDQ